MNINDFPEIKKIEKLFKPLRIELELISRKDIYYLIIDGTKTYEDPGKWELSWISFENYVSSHVRKIVTGKPKLLTKTRLEYKIGTLLDILKTA